MTLPVYVEVRDLIRNSNMTLDLLTDLVAHYDLECVADIVGGLVQTTYVPLDGLIEALVRRNGDRTDDIPRGVTSPLLTVDETADMLKISKSALYERLLATGRLPSIKEGRTRRISRDAVLRYIAEREEKAQ